MMEIKNRIVSNFPLTIKDDKIFNSVIEAEAKSLKFLKDYAKEYTDNVNVYNQESDMLKKTVSFFSFLEQLNGETENGLKNRFRALFVRNNVSPWGTIYSIKNVFRQYFGNADVYIQENTRDIADNLIVDGDFEYNSTEWKFENCSLVQDDKFSGKNSVFLEQGSEISQTISNIENKCCTVHFFMKGKIKLKIKNSSGQYWDFDNLTWESNTNGKVFSCEDWNNQSAFFIVPTFFVAPPEDITVCFEGIEESYLDYVEFYKKKKNATFTVVCRFTGVSADGALVLAPGTNDPVNDNIDRTMYGFYDHTHFTGIKTGFAKDIYNDLLQYLKPVGVQAYLNILVKEK